MTSETRTQLEAVLRRVASRPPQADVPLTRVEARVMLMVGAHRARLRRAARAARSG